MNRLYDTYAIDCPKCGVRIHVPYFKEIEPMTEDEINQEIAEGWVEVQKLMGTEVDNASE